jgi:hypothetical protein
MSPCATSRRDGLLEHPDEAFAYYRDEGITEVMVEEKHMGSRALIAICRDADAARRRFGVATGETGMAQPAVKCRGPEYLRIIYGPEYDAPEHLARLRDRGLGKKRSLAIREFLLGAEALQRFTAREPLRRMHEAVFGVPALEAEPIDPRL